MGIIVHKPLEDLHRNNCFAAGLGNFQWNQEGFLSKGGTLSLQLQPLITAVAKLNLRWCSAFTYSKIKSFSFKFIVPSLEKTHSGQAWPTDTLCTARSCKRNNASPCVCRMVASITFLKWIFSCDSHECHFGGGKQSKVQRELAPSSSAAMTWPVPSRLGNPILCNAELEAFSGSG